MNRAAVTVIVEGHGEQQSAARTLLTRIWTELLGGEYLHVLAPIRRPRAKLTAADELLKAIELATLKLADVGGYDQKFVLVLFDADEDLPCTLGPSLQQLVVEKRPDVDVAVVLANVEWESWFVGAAESLARANCFDLTAAPVSTQPERDRQGKGVVSRLMHGRYGETIDQPRLSALMDLAVARQRCPSFDKLCRELEKRRSAS